MSLAVLDLDIDDLPETLDTQEGEEGAVVLLRIGGRVGGQAVLWHDAADRDRPLRDRLLRAAGSSFWERWLERELGVAESEPDPGALSSATVVICTRERPDDLQRCLESLCAMAGASDILVIDNAPVSQDTRDVVARFPQVRYALEPRKGLDNARNAALRLVTTDIIAFIDDDAVADKDWLHNLLRNFDDPLVMAAGGLTMALQLETPAQIAFQRVGGFTRGFKRLVHDASTTDPFDAWHAAAGVNLAIRRSVVDAIGLFDDALDAGTLSCAGGDTDYCRRILAAGYRIVYDPQALNWHRHRRSMEELQQQIFGYECAFFAILTKALFLERNPRSLGRLARWLRHHLPALFHSLRQRHTRDLPFNVATTQLRGALAGPSRYFRARRQVRHG